MHSLSFVLDRIAKVHFRSLIIFVYLFISISLFTSGCGGEKDADGFHGSVERIPADEMAAMADLPREGMVRSALTNVWICEEVSWQRPVAVMFQAGRKQLPLYGLDRISLFYEMAEEDGTSLQMGILEDWHGLERIGAFGGIREDFICAALEYDPVIVHAGEHDAYTEELLARTDVDDLNSADLGEAADIGSDRILAAIEEAEFQQIHRNELYYGKEHFTFASYSEPNTLEQYTDAVSAAEVDMSEAFPETRPSLIYHADDGLYYRNVYGKPQTDGKSGAQLAFANILIQKAVSAEQGTDGSASLQMQDSAKEGYYITRGRMIPVRWEKTEDYQPTRFFDRRGEEITVNAGRTMIFVIREGRDSFTADGTAFD